jgi:hypothetical protein
MYKRVTAHNFLPLLIPWQMNRNILNNIKLFIPYQLWRNFFIHGKIDVDEGMKVWRNILFLDSSMTPIEHRSSYLLLFFTKVNVRTMAQAVSRRLLTAETRLRSQANSYGIRCGQIGTGTGLSQGSSVFACKYHSTLAFHTHISSGCWKIGLLEAAVQRHCLTASTWTTTKFNWR